MEKARRLSEVDALWNVLLPTAKVSRPGGQHKLGTGEPADVGVETLMRDMQMVP